MIRSLDVPPRSRERALLDLCANVLHEVRPLVERQADAYANWQGALARINSTLAAVDDLRADEMRRAEEADEKAEAERARLPVTAIGEDAAA